MLRTLVAGIAVPLAIAAVLYVNAWDRAVPPLAEGGTVAITPESPLNLDRFTVSLDAGWAAEGVCAGTHRRHRGPSGRLEICGMWIEPEPADDGPAHDVDFEKAGGTLAFAGEFFTGRHSAGAVANAAPRTDGWSVPATTPGGGGAVNPAGFTHMGGAFSGPGMLGWNVPRIRIVNAPAVADSVFARPAVRAERAALSFAGLDGAGSVVQPGRAAEFSEPVKSSVSGSISGSGAVNFMGGLTNRGALVFSAGTADIYGNITHNGPEVRVAEKSTVVFHGSLHGSGALAGGGTVSLVGSYNPGNSPAVVSVGANFTYNPGSLQIMEIFGLLPGPGHPGPEDGHDKLLFSGAANPQVIWDGTLRIDLGNGFHPLAGMTFDLFDFDNTRDAGAFTTILVNDPGSLLAPGLAFDYSQLYVDGTVSIIAVPEPASALLLLLGGLPFALRRRALAQIFPRKNHQPSIP